MSDDDDEAGGKPRAKFGLWRSPETKLEQASTDTGKEEEELLEKLDLKRHDENGHDVEATYGTIDFVIDRDNDAPARFIVVSSRADPQSICKVMTDVWHLTRPSVILSVTGGAGSLGLNAQLEEAYVKGLANAAQSTRSWIISGGSDAGVMQLTGKVMSWLGAGTPCIGIASYDVVMYKDKFVKAPDSELTRTGTGLSPRSRARYAKKKKKSREVKYWKQDKPVPGKETAIDPNHTHFVLVDNFGKKGFGGEVEMRANIEEYMAREAGGSRGEVPLVCLCVGGGPNTFDTLLEQIRLQNMVLLLAESGGAAGAITKFIEAYREGFQQEDATDQQLIELVDKLAEDKLIGENEQKKIKSQAKADKTGKVKTVARVLVEAVTATPQRIHFHKQEDGPFDEVRLRVRVSWVLPFLVLALTLSFAWRPPILTLTLTLILTLTLTFTLPLTRRSCTWSSRRITA